MFRKQFAVLAISALMVFGLALNGCSRREAGRYYSKDKGFSIRFPDKWETKEGFMGTTILAVSAQEGPADTFRENVNVYVEELPRVYSLEEYWQLSLTNLRKLMTDFKEYDSGKATIGGEEATWLIYSFRMGTVKTKVIVYALVKGRRGYVITCSAGPDKFDEYKTTLEEIAESFKFE